MARTMTTAPKRTSRRQLEEEEEEEKEEEEEEEEEEEVFEDGEGVVEASEGEEQDGVAKLMTTDDVPVKNAALSAFKAMNVEVSRTFAGSGRKWTLLC